MLICLTTLIMFYSKFLSVVFLIAVGIIMFKREQDKIYDAKQKKKKSMRSEYDYGID